ncbi:MAG: DUF7146 domain-containing protein, partial [Gammaproteobacteria bacterium]
DKIVCSRTDRKENIHSSEFATVKNIVEDKITIVRADNSQFTFNGKDEKYKHWDHAYAVTAYGAQGGTYSTVLALFESYRKNLMNLKTFLVTLTRPVNNLRIYTDDKAKLQDQIAANKGEKLSSLEVIGKYPAPSKKIKNHSIVSKNHEKVITGSKFTYDLQRIKEGLNQNAEQIAIEILGQPKVRGGNYLKFGSKQGSLSVTTKGEKAGWWNDFSESNAKGRSMLSFIQTQYSMSKSEAIEYAAKWLGIAPSANENPIKKPMAKAEKQSNHSLNLETDYQKKMHSKAIGIAKESVPLPGTLAEVYLKKHRGINTDDMKLSGDLRFHAGIYSSINKQKLPALVGIVRDKKGDVISVETVYLDPDSGNKAMNITVGKQTFGSKKGGSVITNLGEQGDTVILAEGTVTALSVAKALPNTTVKSVLGKQLLAAIDPSTLPKNVVLCLDYDGKELRSDKAIREAADRLKAHDKQVSFMIPVIKDSEKHDYNDVLKLKGDAIIQSDFKNTISYQDFYKNYLNDSLLKAGIKLVGQQVDQGKTNKISPTKVINQADINQFSQKLSHENWVSHQKTQQTIDKVIRQQSAEKIAEIHYGTVNLEREI